MKEQPTALRLADELEEPIPKYPAPTALESAAAAELRRMHDLLGKANALCRIRAEEIERLKAQPKQEPVIWMYQSKSTHEVRFQKHMRSFVDHGAWYEVPLYSEPLANQEKTSGSPKPAKPEALRLADAMEYDLDWCDEAAAKLRRLHEANQAMLEANKASLLVLCALSKADWHPNVRKDIDFAIQANRSAIAKGEQQ